MNKKEGLKKLQAVTVRRISSNNHLNQLVRGMSQNKVKLSESFKLLTASQAR
jgi:hypothetical protein